MGSRGAGYFRPVSKVIIRGVQVIQYMEDFWEGGLHWSEVITAESIDFIKQAAKSKKPFFMQIAFNAPHDPRQSPNEYILKYPIENINLPKNFLSVNPHADAMELAKGMER